MALCFRAAFDQKRQKFITEADYLSHLVAHFGGVRHLEDDTDDARSIQFLRNVDPFGSSIRHLALRTAFRPLTYTSSVYELFWNCLVNDMDQFKSSYEQLKKLHPSINLIQPAAVLAATKQHINIMQYCLENGALFDDDMDNAIQKSEYTSSGMRLLNYQWSIPFLELLYKNDWKQMRTSLTSLRDLTEPRFSIEVLKWFLDHGARLGPDFVRGIWKQSAVKVNFLVEQLGIDIFRGSGVLNKAAIEGQTDVVEVLLDADICIIDTPPIMDIREPGPYTALLEAVKNRHLDAVKLLLDRGSPICEASKSEAKRQGGDMVALIDRHCVGQGTMDRQIHICTQEICDPRGRRRHGPGQGNAESPSFSYLFGD